MELFKILCVDDEPNVISGLNFQLHRYYTFFSATSGNQGLEILRKEGPFAVVLSDMRMPGMDGATFLTNVKQLSPDSVRMLLTGQTDIHSAIKAVNEGQVFRFLTKPCPPEQIRLSFSAAVEQHKLIVSERVLLEQTLRGSIRALTEILSLTNPMVFGRATHISEIASALAKEHGVASTWQLEVAAVLSQLGMVTLPDELIDRYYHGQKLSEQELVMISRVPKISQEILAHIPRLDTVHELISHTFGQGRIQLKPNTEDSSLYIMGHILRAAVDFDKLEHEGLSPQIAIETMRGRENIYETSVLDALAKWKKMSLSGQIREIPVRDATVGMVLAEDIRTAEGMVLIARGYELTFSAVERLRNFKRGGIREPLRIVERWI